MGTRNKKDQLSLIEKTEEDLKEVITIGYIVSIFMIFNI